MSLAGPADCDAFIRTSTVSVRDPFVPELLLQLATEIVPVWHATEAWLARANVDPPFWAFAWPGGLALARHILDHPQLVSGRRVLDFAAGSGIAALAAARAGAAMVEAADIDPMAMAATRLNAAANDLTITTLHGDVVGEPCRWDLILAGDVFYEAPMTRRILPWLRGMGEVAEIWAADPGRRYVPRGLSVLATYHVPTNPELEDSTEKRTTLYRLSPAPPKGR